MENEVHLGEKIRALRRMKGIKQATLAKALGIVQQNVSKMEHRKRIPEDRLGQAARILGITVEELKSFDHKDGTINNHGGQHDTVSNGNPLEGMIELYDVLMNVSNAVAMAGEETLQAKDEATAAQDALIRELRKGK